VECRVFAIAIKRTLFFVGTQIAKASALTAYPFIFLRRLIMTCVRGFNLRALALMPMAVVLVTASCAGDHRKDPGSAVAALAAPGEIPLPGTISTESQRAFKLFMDTDNSKKVIYYIPNQGMVAVNAANSSNPKPRFMVSSRTTTTGFFAGEEVLYIGGALDTTGLKGALESLHREAAAAGHTIEPAPVDKATTSFAVAAHTVDPTTGRFQVKCEQVEAGRRADGKPIIVPECKIKSSPDSDYDLSTEIGYSVHTRPYNGSTINGQIPFQFVTTPGWVDNISKRLEVGAGWDDLIVGTVDWSLTGERLTHKAVLNIHWDRVYEMVSTFFAFHNFACIDVEVQTFFEKLTDCEDGEWCGIKIDWYDSNGRLTTRPSSNADFLNVVTAVQKELQDELMQRLIPDESKLGRVSTDTSAQWTLRANYEKRVQKINESREVYWNPGAKSLTASTSFSVDCIKGQVGEGLKWNMDDAGCKDIIGQ